MLWRWIYNFFAQDIAMDLGTANTLLYTKRLGLAINEPSVVAWDLKSRQVMAVGRDAKSYLGRTPQNITTVRPLKEGVIADFDMTRAMISHFVSKILSQTYFVKPVLVICIPMGITQVEKKAVIDAAILAGASQVKLVEEPMAAAIGAGLNVHAPNGQMVLDIGGGTSEVAVITLDGIAQSQALRIAGDAMTNAVQCYIHDNLRVTVGENTAEQVKINLGAAVPDFDLPPMEVSGKDVVTGAPKVITITPAHIYEALQVTSRLICDSVLRCLEGTPPELSSDILQNGLLLVGGGSLLHGFDQLLAKETGLKVTVEKDPLTTVLRGTAKTMLDPKNYKQIFIN